MSACTGYLQDLDSGGWERPRPPSRGVIGFPVLDVRDI